MALPSTLKRHDPSSNDNDGLNDDDDDVTWGGKRPRFIYNFVLDDSPLLSDSDETESIHSSQSKSTMQLLSDENISVESSCCSDCGCHSSESNFTEFDVRSSSSSYNIDSNFSDSSTTLEFKMDENSTMCDNAVLSSKSDVGYLPDDTDVQDSNRKVNLPPPACFKFCLQCKKDNPNPFFQYCHTCFRHRMEYFEDKPDSKRKSNKLLSSQKKEENILIDSHKPDLPNSQDSGIPNSQDSGLPNSQDTTLSSYSSLLLSQENNINSTDVETSMTDKNINSRDLCNICFRMPKNGIFNHNKIGHVFSCYPCSKKLWKKSQKCPVCSRKIKYVTRLIMV